MKQRDFDAVDHNIRPKRMACKLAGLMAVAMAFFCFDFSAKAQTATLLATNQNIFAGANYNGVYTNSQLRATLSGTGGGTVTLSVSGAPAGVTILFSTNGYATTSNPLDITNSWNPIWYSVAVTNVAKGIYPLTFTCSGAASASAVVNLIVGPRWVNSTPAGDVRWSTGANWSTGVAPGSGDEVMFQDAGNTNYVDSSVSVNSLAFIPLQSGTSQSMAIASGQTLSVVGTNGFTLNSDSVTSLAKTFALSIYGSGGAALVVSNNQAVFTVNSCQGTGGATSGMQLNMTNLDNFGATVNRFGLGDWTMVQAGGVAANELATASGANGVQFAKTNTITALYSGNFDLTNFFPKFAISLLMEGDVFNNGSQQNINLGITNAIFADSLAFAQNKAGSGNNVFRFNPVFTNVPAASMPYVSFRNTNGGRMSLVGVGIDSGTAATGSNTRGGMNFTGGMVDMLVDTMWLGRNRTASVATNTGSLDQGVLTFTGGKVDVNYLRAGYQAYTNNSWAQGQINVGGSGATTAVLSVNTNLELGYTSGDFAATFGSTASQGNGQVTINTNGIVRANQVTVGTFSANNFITINNGGLLDVTNTVASTATRLGKLTVNSGGAITLHINGASTLVYVTNLVASSGIINIGSVTASSFASVISYAPGFGETASFVAGSVPPGYNATVFNNTTTHTIDVTLTTGTPKTLLWQGYVNNNWDTTTKNWLDLSTSVHTNFSTGDSAVFNDSASFFSINVAEDVVPRQSAGINGMAMTNNTHAYVFSGPGGIRGAASFAKYGTGSVEIDNYSEIAVTVNQGSLTGGGTIGSAVFASGTVGSLLAGGNVIGSVSTAGSLTNAATIGSSLSILTGGAVTNTVAGTVNGTLSMETGTSLGNAGTFSSLGSPTIPTNAVVFNDGTIKGNALSVSGTLEDTGIGTINMNTALTINGGGTFIPGGDSIGTTTIYENPLGAAGITGRLLLGTGSTNVFKVNMDSGIQNTVVRSVYTSFGPNQSSVAYNGGTIVIVKTGSASFAAGQSFPLFQNTYGGSLGNAGLNTTNSYPVISPANPGPGLQWDLSTVIQNGTIGIKTINMAPTNLVYSAALINSGSNIVTHLQWPSDYTGWYLQSQQNPLTIGLSTNWTTIGGSSFTNDMVFTNAVITNTAVFYRMVFPQP